MGNSTHIETELPFWVVLFYCTNSKNLLILPNTL